MTTAAAAFLPPETVGIPQRGPLNTYAALDEALSVETLDRHGDELRPVAGTAVADSTGIKDFIDKLFDEFFGPDAPTDPTPLRIKGLFNDEARVVDRLLNDINEEHKRHATRTSQQITSLEESEMFTCGAIRADVTSLRTKTRDALILLRTETWEALSLTFNSISGLTASALNLKLDQAVTGLLESSARATQDILELRQELNGGGSSSDLAMLARQSEQAVIGLLETSTKNAQAILELRQELAGCVAIKTTVDDIKTRQLTQIWENKTHFTTGLADITTQYSTLDSKYSEAFNAVNIWVDDILREGIPSTTAPTHDAATPPMRNATSSPSSPPTVGASMPMPANVVPTSAPPGDGRMDSGISRDMPCSDAPDQRLESHQARHSDCPNLPGAQDFRDSGGATSVRWRPQLDPRRSSHTNGTFQRKDNTSEDSHSATRPPTNPYYGSRDTRNELARSDPRQYTAHVPPPTSLPQEVDVEYDLDEEARLPQGGQIVSPRHWDWRQLAHTAGHSPLDAAALVCREYHGYQRGYYPLTAEIMWI